MDQATREPEEDHVEARFIPSEYLEHASHDAGTLYQFMIRG
jgi:hypothetical protein